MDLYCHESRFVRSFNNAGLYVPRLVQGNDLPVRIYLLKTPWRSTFGYFPFVYDDNSGKTGVSATVSLLHFAAQTRGSTYAETLSGPTSCALIPDGFSAILDLATLAINSFLNVPEKTCYLSVDIVDVDGHHLNPFRGVITLEQGTPSTGVDPSTPIPGTIRLYGLDGFTGGGSTKVDGAAQTAGKPLETIFYGIVNDVLHEWELREGTADSDPPGVIRPTDYNASTNPRNLILVGS